MYGWIYMCICRYRMYISIHNTYVCVCIYIKLVWVICVCYEWQTMKAYLTIYSGSFFIWRGIPSYGIVTWKFSRGFLCFFSFSYSFAHTYIPAPPPLPPSFLHFQRNEEEIKWESNCVREKCSTSIFGCFVLLLKSLLPIAWFFVTSKDTDRYVRGQNNTENSQGKGGRNCIALNLKLLYGIDNNRLSLD